MPRRGAVLWRRGAGAAERGFAAARSVAAAGPRPRPGGVPGYGSPPAPGGGRDEGLGTLFERAVELSAQVRAERQIQADGRCDHGHRYGEAGDGRDASAQRHGSRST